ncbi:MAG TPA: hypothetical protein VN736_14560 [Candidatus Limnocylindrales bacterium]|nr:hypothetical protein [Candidatus Limnocylindrales bacterium]
MNKQQFRVLYRDFLFRIVDLEILAPQGDVSKLLGQFAALLVFVSLWLALIAGVMSGARTNTPAGMILSWLAGHFLISTTMLAVGLFAVMSWDSMFPDRRDVLVLFPLPIRARTLLTAKIAASASAVGVTVLALNIFSGLLVPFAAGRYFLRWFAAYWLTMTAAGVFILCGVLTIQGLAQLLPRQRFLRVSTILQMAFFFAMLTVYLLQPPFSEVADLLRNRNVLMWVPSYWFLGLFEELCGGTLPIAGLLARRATIGLGLSLCGAAASYLLCYWRTLRKIAEQPDILPGRSGLRWLPRFGNSFQTAVGQFSVRTLLRSRQHRVILSFYSGIGFGLAMFLAGDQGILRTAAGNGAWYRVNTPLLMGSIIILCFVVMGARVVFAMPLELRANWIFRVAAHANGRACLAAARRSLYALSVIPVWTAAAIVFFRLWPRAFATQHLLLLAALGCGAAELALHGFRKIPFTCSYLPGKLRFNMALVYLFFFLLAVTKGAAMEMTALHTPRLYREILAGLTVLAVAAFWRTAAEARSAESSLRFDEAPDPAIHALDLHRDGVTLLG